MSDSQGLRDVLNGRKRLSAELLASLVVLGIDVSYILTGQRSAPSTPSLSEGDRVLLDNFHAAPPQVQAGIKTTLGAFAPAGGTAKRTRKAVATGPGGIAIAGDATHVQTTQTGNISNDFRKGKK